MMDMNHSQHLLRVPSDIIMHNNIGSDRHKRGLFPSNAQTEPTAATMSSESHYNHKRYASGSHISLHQTHSTEFSNELLSFHKRSNSHAKYIDSSVVKERRKINHQRLLSKITVPAESNIFRNDDMSFVRKTRASFHSQEETLDNYDSLEFEKIGEAVHHRRFPSSSHAYEHNSTFSSSKLQSKVCVYVYLNLSIVSFTCLLFSGEKKLIIRIRDRVRILSSPP